MIQSPPPPPPHTPTFRVRVADGGEFAITPHQTLLQGALAAGMAWPHGCRVGLCGSCRCRLVEGSVQPLGDFSAVLDHHQRQQGYVLACRSRIISDLTVADLPPLGPEAAGSGDATVVEVRPLTPLIHQLTLALANPYPNGYAAGQYAHLQIPQTAASRCFSFATASRGDGRLAFHVRLFAEGQFSRWLAATGPGDHLQVGPPLGSAVVRDPNRPLLLFAGGSGLAPILAALEELAAMERAPATRLVYAARSREHLYALDDLDALGQRWPGPALEFVPVLSREAVDSGWRGHRGHVFDHLDALTRGFNHPAVDVYLCGPPGLVDAIQLFLLKAGYRRDQLRADRFLPAF